MQLRPYQQAAVDAVYQYLRKHDDNPCVVVPTAGGKTPILATIVRDAVSLWNGRVMIISHVKELLQQAEEKLLLIAPDIDAGLYSAGLKRFDTKNACIVAGIQSVFRRPEEFGRFDLIIVDECFPAGTPISTPRGEVAIEDLYVGQPVHTALGVGEVECISSRPAFELVKLELSNGNIIECTPNHPFFTETGWRKAEVLELGSRLFRREDLLMLRERVSSVHLPASGRESKKCDERESLEEAAFLLNILREESGEPDVPTGHPGKDGRNSEGDRASSEISWRERATVDGSAEAVEGEIGGDVRFGVRRDYNAFTKRKRSGALLQTRLGDPRPENRDSVGWKQSLIAGDSENGQTPQNLVGGVRVVGVARLKLASPRVVYNLQIKEHPSYFAHGTLVHNCHMIPASGDGMYRSCIAKLTEINPLLRVIGLTATPYRMTSGMICKPENILNRICYQVGIKDLMNDGFLAKLTNKEAASSVATDNLHIRGGEFVESEVQELMNQTPLIEKVAVELVNRTRDRKSVLIFCAGIAHAEKVLAEIRKYSDSVDAVFGDTLPGFRDSILAEFKAGKIKYLVNVGVLTTGFDAPNIDCVALLRPTNSPGLYYQMVGRGFRLHPAKEDCMVLDFAGNVMRHGPVDMLEVDFNEEEKKKSNGKKCPKCDEVVAVKVMVCPACGHIFIPEKKADPHLSLKASNGELISGDNVPMERIPVLSASYHVHSKRDADPGDPRTMRIDYHTGLLTYSQWVCPEHIGYARRKFITWWQQNAPGCDLPESAEDAVWLANEGALAVPNSITVRQVPGKRYAEIVDVQYPERKPIPTREELDAIPF